MPKKPVTVASAKLTIKKLIREHERSRDRAEADGGSDYDYYEGLLDAYGVALAMLTQIEPDREED